MTIELTPNQNTLDYSLNNDENTSEIEIFNEESYHVCIDYPTGIIREPLTTICGWIASTRAGVFDFYINNVIQKRVYKFKRPDVENIVQNNYCSGWRFSFDSLSLMSKEQQAIVFEIKTNGRVIHRSLYRCEFPVSLYDSKKTPVYFIHMPKTGGTSIRKLFENKSDIIRILSVYDNSELISIEEFQSFSDALVSRLDVVFGHFKYGLHRSNSGKYRYMSMVRNPFDFVRSYYFFSLHNRSTSLAKNQLSVFDALNAKDDIHFDNIFTRYFANVPDNCRVDRSDYLKAIDNINTDFEFIGTTEYMKQSKSYIGKYFGQDLGFTKINITREYVEDNLLDPVSFRRAARNHIEYDLALYDYVLERFWGSGNLTSLSFVDPIPAVVNVSSLTSSE